MHRARPGRLLRLLAAMAALTVVAAACGSDGSASDEGASGDGGSDDSGAASDVSAAEVSLTNVADGTEINLDELLANEADKPKLAWFWAPHCPTCRSEAPELDEFMATNAERVDLVGIGSRDDYDLAEGFLADTGVTNFPLYWEETGESWVDNAVAAQPYMILFVDGEDVERWPGGASIRQIEDALAEHT